ncbi:MAG: cysteine peptidase family C39 domain-containing protein [Malacoplasma sp.]
MKVIYQEYEYECGICVLSMIHNFLYKTKLDKQLIKNEILYSKKGMSLEDFETNSLILGFESTSYKIPYDEFINSKINDYFITCINSDNAYHYVICKIIRNSVVIYDSAKGKYKISLDEFKKIFTKIIVIFKKREQYNYIFKEKNIVNKKLFFDHDYRFCFLFILLEGIIFFSTLLSSIFIKVFINDIFPTKNTYSLIFTILFFLILYIFNSLMEMLIKYFKFKKFKNIFKLNFYIYLNIMKYKSKSFFDKIDRKIIYQFLNFINIEIEKKYFLIPSSIFDIFSVVVLIIFIAFTSPYFIFVIAISVIFSIALSLIKKTSNEKYYNELELSNNQITNDLNNFYSFLENEKNYFKTKSFVSNLQNQIKSNFNISSKKMFLDSLDSSMFIFLDKFIFLILSLVSSLIVFELNVNIQISSILLSFTLLNLLNNSINNIMELFSKIPIYKKSKVYINDLERLFNIELNNDGLSIDDIKEISLENISFNYDNTNKQIFNSLNLNLLNDSFISGKNGIGKSTLFRLLSLDYETKIGDIFFNKINIKNLSKKCIYEKVILQSSDSVKTNLDFSTLLSINEDLKAKIISLIKKLNINLGNLSKENLSKGEIQIINFLSLLEEKNKLILLDESLSNVDDEMVLYLFENFKKYIWENNFVLFISHNKKLKKYFSKEVRI